MPHQPHQKPRWLKKRLPTGPEYEKVKGLIGKDRLHTVCQVWAHGVRAIAGFVRLHRDLQDRLIRLSRTGWQRRPGKWVSVMS
jgi:hypothetical protein